MESTQHSTVGFGKNETKCAYKENIVKRLTWNAVPSISMTNKYQQMRVHTHTLHGHSQQQSMELVIVIL